MNNETILDQYDMKGIYNLNLVSIVETKSSFHSIKQYEIYAINIKTQERMDIVTIDNIGEAYNKYNQYRDTCKTIDTAIDNWFLNNNSLVDIMISKIANSIVTKNEGAIANQEKDKSR